MEVSECGSTEFDSDFDPLEIPHPIPKGLASVPDSLYEPLVQHEKPSLITKALISGILFLFHITTWSFQAFHWILNSLFGITCRQKVLYRELHQISKSKDPGQIRGFLEENTEHPFAAGYLFSEFALLPELYPYLADILQGANICLNDSGFFCRRWSEYPKAYERFSSHTSLNGKCFAIDHLLFWQDDEGNTRFQFENSPFNGLFGGLYHTVDFLRYKRDNLQQGVAGTSLFTEANCLKVEIDLMEFIFRNLG